ncbi:hypothetical protein OG864_45160 [Streptomyces sp. NBC_00124]|uniref:hypothetical protein n=1 Tax=Streptomyces sp. NBC_00124 TaxID=2975662 RepID=UPI002255C094|nr:hypothetical protein [Streptomyces sp. NBC_00124]MCX5365892.1 hypothetical protein [Streptomyces sp. NBC_00124]
MRDPQTAQLLAEVQQAVVNARDGGVTARACIFDATAAAIDGGTGWPSPEARKTAEDACRAIDPPTCKAGPKPPPPPVAARALFWLANRIASRTQR